MRMAILKTAKWCAGILALTSVIAGCGHAPSRPLCDSLRQVASWDGSMRSPKGDYAISGRIAGSPQGLTLHLTGTSGEGSNEMLEYKADSLVIAGDSVHFRFAPLGIQVAGRCVSGDSVVAEFEMPQPGFPPITGNGFIRRVR